MPGVLGDVVGVCPAFEAAGLPVGAVVEVAVGVLLFVIGLVPLGVGVRVVPVPWCCESARPIPPTTTRPAAPASPMMTVRLETPFFGGCEPPGEAYIPGFWRGPPAAGFIAAFWNGGLWRFITYVGSFGADPYGLEKFCEAD